MSGRFSVKLLCELMGIRRSSFYNWKRHLSRPAQRTKQYIENISLFSAYHLKYPSHGYRWLNAKIRLDTGLVLSDPYAHKCWLYMDLWNNEIVSHALSSMRGDRMTYISGLEDVLALKQQFPEHEMILHSDQGSVYSSKKYNELLPMYGITRSMSRAGTPTDNAAMEAINGWIKAELFADLHVTGDKPVAQEIDEYVIFFNEQRPAYSLNYLTPKQYREKCGCVQIY